MLYDLYDLVTIQDSFLYVLDSVNADTYNNGSKKSLCTFYLEEPITKRLEALQMTCSVLQFTIPNSIYNINSPVFSFFLVLRKSKPSLSLKSFNGGHCVASF